MRASLGRIGFFHPDEYHTSQPIFSSNKEKNLHHALATLVGINFTETEKNVGDKINDKCYICLFDLNENKDALFVILECSHIFHRDCIVEVLSNECPLCKKTIIDNLIFRVNNPKYYFILSSNA